MGLWRGATFNECIQEELESYSKGMSRDMKHKFGFVNVVAGAFVDIISTMVSEEYNSNARAA